MKRRSIVEIFVTTLVAAVMVACSRDSSYVGFDDMGMSEPAMTTEEAEDILYSAETELGEYSHQIPFSLFCWDERYAGSDRSKALSYHDTRNGNDVYELDFDSQYRLQFYRRRRFGGPIFYDSFQKLQIIRNNESGKTGAFIKTVIDFGGRRSKGFSGLIAYTRLDGKLVAVDRYDSDALVESLYLPGFSGQDANVWRMNYLRHILEGIRVKRITNYPLTKSGEDDDSTWNLVIDSAAVCIADTSDTTEYFDPDEDPWADDWLPDDYWEDEGDPNPGGGGGGGYSGHGGSNGNQGASESIKVGSKSATVKYGSEVSLESKGEFQQKLKELTEIQLFKDIFKNLDLSKVTITVSSGKMNSWESGRTQASYIKYDDKYSSVKIELNTSGHVLGYLEEFFHAYQYLNSNMPFPLQRGDMEFEAKVLIARYYFCLSDDGRKSYGRKFEDNEEYFKSIYNYCDDPKEDLRDEALLAFVRLGYLGYDMSYEGEDLDSHLNEILALYYIFYPKESK